MRRRNAERGEGNLGCILWLVVLGLAVMIAWKAIPVKVAADAASIVLVPEARELVPGVGNILLLFVTDPLGEPIPNTDAVITVPDGRKLTAHTDAFGQARVSFIPPADTVDGTFSV